MPPWVYPRWCICRICLPRCVGSLPRCVGSLPRWVGSFPGCVYASLPGCVYTSLPGCVLASHGGYVRLLVPWWVCTPPSTMVGIRPTTPSRVHHGPLPLSAPVHRTVGQEQAYRAKASSCRTEG